MLNRIWETLVRWRTWIFNTTLALLFALPPILNSPEILAVIPPEYQRWFLVAAFLANNWLRPRAASIASDPEVQVKKALKHTDAPATITVESRDVKAVIDA